MRLIFAAILAAALAGCGGFGDELRGVQGSAFDEMAGISATSERLLRDALCIMPAAPPEIGPVQ